MIKEILSILKFLLNTHKKQIISLGGIYIALIIISRLLFSNSNLFYYDSSGILVFVSFALVIFIFSAYLGYIFRVENKSNFMTILPFSSKALNATPHILIFILAASNYLLLKGLWDEAHVFIGVSEVSFLFGAPYIVYYSLKKIEIQWIGVLTAFVICFVSLFFWMKFLTIWNMYQWGIVTELAYAVVTLLLVLVLEKRKSSVAVVFSCLLVFLAGKTIVDISLAPANLSQAIAKVQFFPHKYSVEKYTDYMITAKNWEGFKISPYNEGSSQRKLFKYTRHFNGQFWSDDQKLQFLKLITTKISFDKENNQHFDFYSYRHYPMSKNTLPKEKRIFLVELGALNPIGCYYLPLIDNQEVRDSLFNNPKCGKTKLLSNDIKWDYYKAKEDSFLLKLKPDFLNGKGRDVSEIDWGVSTLFGLYGKTHGKSRSWYKESGITNHEFDELTKNIYSDEREFFKVFNKSERNVKLAMLDELDFSNDESRHKSWKRLKFICRDYSNNCNDLPRWKDKSSFVSILKDHFLVKDFPGRSYYWLFKEIERNI